MNDQTNNRLKRQTAAVAPACQTALLSPFCAISRCGALFKSSQSDVNPEPFSELDGFEKIFPVEFFTKTSGRPVNGNVIN